MVKARVQEKKGKASARTENMKRKEDAKQSQETAEIVAIESDVESDAELQIDQQADSKTEQSAGTGPAVQSTGANTSATPMGADARTILEVEQAEEEVEAEMAKEICMPTQEELVLAVASAPTPIPILKTVSSLLTSPAPISSTVETTSPMPSTLLIICEAITDRLRYALGQ